ncbi:ABC transporter substrate-binding (seleno)protein SaoB [Clostridium ihumii]|uniref:ABC transporter substrate-binding (seleno)protein SaoB n=1 Tax=Clostridium ihumii TaxID=1470356 RepID=UPI001FA79AF1|nr:ABC transporter substrate-binding (seleno)protein SaoB [Clostridium ihumii]
MCSSKANEFVKSDNRFEIVSPVIQNSNLVVMKNEKIKKIGVSEGRSYEKDIAKKMFKETFEIVELPSKSLPYAMEKGDVGGIVIDYLKSLEVIGERKIIDIGEDYNTFSIIVKKEIKDKEEFKRFISAYDSTIDFLQKEDNFLQSISENRKKDYVNERRRKEWKMLNMKMLKLKE